MRKQPTIARQRKTIQKRMPSTIADSWYGRVMAKNDSPLATV
ncbi:MAG: hypothetical protein ACI9KE_006761, partial [Polyangiales bacterium]